MGCQSQLWVLFVVFSISFSLVSSQACDTACQAYVWGYPLWHEINQRYQQAANSPTFSMNSVAARVSAIPIPGQLPQLTLCNSTLCAGVAITLFNPSPIVAPNVDTVYGALNWDLGPPEQDPSAALQVTLMALANPTGGYIPIRYASIIFYDHYTNVLAEYVAGAANNTLCLTRTASNPNCPAGSTERLLPRTGFAIVRGYSDGSASSPLAPCGVNGCSYMLGVAGSFKVLSAPTSTVNYNTQYAPYMSAAAGGCPYVYTQPPCGAAAGGSQKNRFWDAICSAIVDYPLSTAEGAYVDATFAPLGITSTGCTALNYAALNTGITSGFAYVASKLNDPTTLITSGPWTFIPFSGNWNVADSATALRRAITSTRLEYMNSNGFAAYWEAATDSTGAPLNAAWGTTYKLVWQSSSPIVNTQIGFWSVTAYDASQYMYNPPAGTDTRQYAVRGVGVPSGEIHLSNVCVSATGCIRVTPGAFSIMIRAYQPTAAILPGANPAYDFPTIVKCTCSAPCY